MRNETLALAVGLAVSAASFAVPAHAQQTGAIQTRPIQVAQGLPTPAIPRNQRTARAGALDQAQRQMVDRISTYMTSVQTLIGDFVQVGLDGRRSEGKFYLQKPGRVRFEYTPPNPLELVSDGKSVAIRDRRLATQDLLLVSQTPLRFLLAEKIDLLREGNVVTVSQDDQFLTVVIDEKQTLGGTHRLQLMFNPKDATLKQWTVTDPQGYDTTVALYNLDASKRPDPGLFRINYETFRN